MSLGAWGAGHGHVFPRPDGVKARCGGPAMCSECARDFYRKMHPEPEPKPSLGAVSLDAGELAAMAQMLCDVSQLLDGWHVDVAWTEWDQSVRRDVGTWAKRVDDIRQTFARTNSQPSNG